MPNPRLSQPVTVRPLALIDIGSNSARMMVVRTRPGGHLDIVADARARLRLMRVVSRDGRLGEEAVARTVATLRSFLQVARSEGAGQTVAVATAAVREAADGAEFVKRLREATGVRVVVIDGDSEARLACLGAVRGLPVEDGLLLDVGGGSLEVARFRGRRQAEVWTLPLGALRLSDRFFASDPPRPAEVAALEDYVRSMLQGARVPALAPGEQAIGTGGTVRSIAKMVRARSPQVIPRLHGYLLRRADAADISRRVCARPLARRTTIAGMNADRGDSITGGAVTLVALLDHLGARELVVSGQGLREGLAVERSGSGLPPAVEVRRQAVEALAARFRTWRPDRASARSAVATQLAGWLDPSLSGEMLETLRHAATLLDIGRSVDFYNRFDHTATMVLVSDLAGFSHRGIALIAAVVGRAGGGRSRTGWNKSLLTTDDRSWIERAALLLALSEEVCRVGGHPPELSIEARRGPVLLRLPDGASWQPAELSKRFRRVFGRELRIASNGAAAAQSPSLELK